MRNVYFYQNGDLEATRKVSDFTEMQIDHDIDGLSSLRASFEDRFFDDDDFDFAPYDDVYVENEEGDIIFGGIVTGYTYEPKKGTFKAIDHRFELKKLIADEEIKINADESVLDKFEEVLSKARAKRSIPIELNKEDSAINPDFRTDLSFKIGDTYAKILKKIVKTTESRWAVRYEKRNNNIIGKLIVRSIFGVTPEGVGISKSWQKAESDNEITLIYEEGRKDNNIKDFSFSFDATKYNSRTKVGTRIDGSKEYIDVPPERVALFLERQFGRTESYVNDYKIDSEETAQTIGRINQNRPEQTIQAVLAPSYDREINAGDRVSVRIETSYLSTANTRFEVDKIAGRIDKVSYTFENGVFERTVLFNLLNPPQRTKTPSISDEIEKLNNRLDGLDKDYLEGK